MVQVLSNLCKKCDGKCCKEFEIFLTRDDLNKLKKFKGKFKIKKEGSAFAMHHSKKCYFLSKNGCILNENQKPLDCRLFPL
ncbi:MAG: YkgJ family cysteine cluster protein, partial [Nanoarchaeota archaeon]|nr:YkgJ family cysteine cluster protein [Nanoarchaeota archaeon]